MKLTDIAIKRAKPGNQCVRLSDGDGLFTFCTTQWQPFVEVSLPL